MPSFISLLIFMRQILMRLISCKTSNANNYQFFNNIKSFAFRDTKLSVSTSFTSNTRKTSIGRATTTFDAVDTGHDCTNLLREQLTKVALSVSLLIPPALYQRSTNALHVCLTSALRVLALPTPV